MKAQLRDAMEQLKPEVGEQVAKEWKEESKENLRESDQGAPELADGKPEEAPASWPVEGYYSDVEQVGEHWEFRIQHPVAPLHEKGGHIEPTYAKSIAMGWTRDGFYEALQDCEEFVTQKNYLRDAAYTIRREYQ